MAKLTQKMKDMIEKYQCFLATVSKDGIPNSAPKGTTRVYDDQTLIFNENTGGATYQNILDGSKLSVSVVNKETEEGYRFVCTPTALDSGEVYGRAEARSMEMGLPKPKAVVLAHIDEIHDLTPGPTAGKKI